MSVTRRLIILVALLTTVTACGGQPELGGVMTPAAPPPGAAPSATPDPSTRLSPTARTPEPSSTPGESASHPTSPTPETETPESDPDSPDSERPVIVIDPGHSGESITSTEPSTGLTDYDYPNDPELYEVWQVSTCVAEALRDLDYRVIMTKDSAEDSVGLARRAEIADRAGADLAISVHNDHSQGPDFQAVYSQRGVKHDGEYQKMWRGEGDTYTVYDHPGVAKDSARYARIIAREREEAQGREVEIAEFDFSGRSGLEPGNLPLVMLLAEVPWVYNEVGALTDGGTTRRMPRKDRIGYAQGLLDGIVAAVPPPSGEDAPTLTCR